MFTASYNDINQLFLDSLHHLMEDGAEVLVQSSTSSQKTKELHPALLELKHPTCRVLTIPNRKNNVFATVAEYVWIMGGRNDLDFLSFYLSGAGNYSDDGKTWRAAYGPRLRSWAKRDGSQVDQLQEVIRILKKDPYSRRAVMVLFDPDLDFVHESKDYPCTNWMHFLYRNDRLDLKVTMRSNDIVFGMSQTNIPIFSMILETMACLLGKRVGMYYHDADSLHIYDNMLEKARTIIDPPYRFNVYEHVSPMAMMFTDETYWAELNRIFTFEKLLRNENTWKEAKNNIPAWMKLFKDPVMSGLFGMLASYSFMKWGDLEGALECLLTAVPMVDWRISGLEFFWRKVAKEPEEFQSFCEERIGRALNFSPKIWRYVKNG